MTKSSWCPATLREISEIVGAILYLESAGFVTGETIHVDGGQSAGR
jgi:NAD(P)-dependent dehydrogenase (short-subunit alcohol dehydrogenase family)